MILVLRLLISNLLMEINKFLTAKFLKKVIDIMHFIIPFLNLTIDNLNR